MSLTIGSNSFLQPITVASSGSGGLFAGGSGGTFASANFQTKTNMNGAIVAADNANVESHTDLTANQVACLDCHGEAHPTAAQRTPGSSDYSRLMERMK